MEESEKICGNCHKNARAYCNCSYHQDERKQNVDNG